MRTYKIIISLPSRFQHNGKSSKAPKLSMALVTSLLFFLVSARFCFDVDVGYIGNPGSPCATWHNIV